MIDENIEQNPTTPVEVEFTPEPEQSPFHPRHLFNLFIRPKRFFSSNLALSEQINYLLVTWIAGISSTIDRIDQQLMRSNSNKANVFIDFFTDSWPAFWLFIMCVGIIWGLWIWWVGGWWYRVRLEWAGCKRPDEKLARLVYIYSSFVYSAPAVLLALVFTVQFSSYSEAYSTDKVLSIIFLFFPFLSIYSSYSGAQTRFQVDTWKARLWFVILPTLVYILVLGLFAVLTA